MSVLRSDDGLVFGTMPIQAHKTATLYRIVSKEGFLSGNLAKEDVLARLDDIEEWYNSPAEIESTEEEDIIGFVSPTYTVGHTEKQEVLSSGVSTQTTFTSTSVGKKFSKPTVYDLRLPVGAWRRPKK